MCNHPHMDLAKPDGTTEEFDLEIIPLVKLLWEWGLRERHSCQGEPHFVDQTHFEAKRYRAFITLELDWKSLNFVGDLLSNFSLFHEEKISWDITIDRERQLPWKTAKDYNPSNKITLHFPHQDIARIMDYLVTQRERQEFMRMVSHFEITEREEFNDLSEEQQGIIDNFMKGD